MLRIFLVFLRLGCTSFGGPAAHLGYFRDEFVAKRRWLSETQFAQCIAITQILPGPASSQTGMLIGLVRGGWPGLFAAWAGFTLPSAILMTAFALYTPPGVAAAGWLHGLLIAAVAVVAYAILMMRRSLILKPMHLVLALATGAAMLLFPIAATPPAAIAVCAVAGLAFRGARAKPVAALQLPVKRTSAIIAFALFLALAIGLPYLASLKHDRALSLAASLFDVGSFVFGGGHVVLPLLESQVVASGMASAQKLIAGYAAAQALPGPLFTLSAYVGAVAYGGSLGVLGSVIGVVAIFSPSFFLIAAVAPFYRALAGSDLFAHALGGANAAVVGLLAAAFVSPIWTTAIRAPADAVLAAAAFAALAFRWPNWLVVLLCAAAGFVFAF